MNQMFCTSAVLRAGPVWMDLKAAMCLGGGSGGIGTGYDKAIGTRF